MSAKPALPLDVIRSAPPHVARVFDFSDWQATHPLEPLPGDSVDAEFDHTNATANAIIDRLALIQRDDGELLNGSVGLDQMDPAVLDAIEEDADAAQASASAAAASAANAATSETNAEAAATAAAASEDNAADSASAAILAKVDAETAAGAAAASAAEAAAAQAAIEEVFILPSPGDANKAVFVNETGDAYILGEAIRYSGTVWLAENRRITDLADPLADQDAATRKFVTDSISLAGSVPPPALSDVNKFLKATAENVFGWGVPREVPAGGTNGHVLRTDGSSYSWTAETQEVPTPADPGDNAKVLLANAGLFGWATFLVDWLGGIAAFMLAFLKTANAPAALAALGGQPLDATLTALGGVATVADDKGKMVQITGADSFAVADIPYAFKNVVMNPSGVINQRANVALSTSYQYFADRWQVAATGAVTAGTSFAAASTGFEMGAYFGSTISTTPANQLALRHRIESVDAAKLSTDTVAARRCSLRLKAFQNSGAACNLNVAIEKANAADNFGATTTIIASTLLGAVPSGVATELKLENLDLGDCRNGVQLYLIWTVAAATALKQFGVGDIQLEANPRCTSLELRPKHVELTMCLRFFEKSFNLAQPPVTALGSLTGEHIMQTNIAGAQACLTRLYFKVPKRTAPTVTIYNPVNANNQFRDSSSGADCSSSAGVFPNENSVSLQAIGAAGTPINGVIAGHWTADAEL